MRELPHSAEMQPEGVWRRVYACTTPACSEGAGGVMAAFYAAGGL